MPDSLPDEYRVTGEDFVTALKSMNHSLGASLDGMRPSHLLDALIEGTRDDFVYEWTALTQLLVSGCSS